MSAVISIKTIKTIGTQSILAAKVPENERNKLEKKFQKDLNNNSPHEAIDFIQNSSWKLG